MILHGMVVCLKFQTPFVCKIVLAESTDTKSSITVLLTQELNFRERSTSVHPEGKITFFLSLRSHAEQDNAHCDK